MTNHALNVIQYVRENLKQALSIKVGSKFHNSLALAIKEIKQQNEQLTAHPLVNLFNELFFEHRDLDVHNLAPLTASCLNVALMDLKTNLDKATFKKKLHNAMRGNKRNHESLVKYLDGLFERHAKLLIVRLDIHYAESISNDITFDKAVKDRTDYINAIKRKYNHLVGYIWKMECGRQRGIHHHLIFIFNGHKVQSDITLCRQLGEDWKSMSDEPRTYYNCNADKDKYEYWKSYGIGTVTYNDSDKRDVLKDKVISYLTKNDEEMLALTPIGYRVVGKSQSPATKQSGGRRRDY